MVLVLKSANLPPALISKTVSPGLQVWEHVATLFIENACSGLSRALYTIIYYNVLLSTLQPYTTIYDYKNTTMYYLVTTIRILYVMYYYNILQCYKP